MRVCLVVKPGHADSGVGRYAGELAEALRRAGLEVLVTHPVVPLPGWLLRLARRFLGLDLAAFFNNYPLWARYPQADIYHLTSQNLASLLWLRRPPGPVVVTVHDLIPWDTRHDPVLRVYRNRLEAWFDRLAIRGLADAQFLISDSEYTASVIRQACPACSANFQTISLAVD
jgi:glycosyltransferase involved in cell wall biosynthesis